MPGVNSKDQKFKDFKYGRGDKRKDRNDKPRKDCDLPWCTHPNPEEPHMCSGHPDNTKTDCTESFCMGQHMCQGHKPFPTGYADVYAIKAAKVCRHQWAMNGIDYVNPQPRAQFSKERFRFRPDVEEQFRWYEEDPKKAAAKEATKAAKAAKESNSKPSAPKKARELISGAVGGKAAHRSEISTGTAHQVFGPPPAAPESVWAAPPSTSVDMNALYDSFAYRQQQRHLSPPMTAAQLFAPTPPAMTFAERRQAALDADLQREQEDAIIAADLERARQERQALAIAKRALERHDAEQAVPRTIEQALAEALANPVATDPEHNDEIDMYSAAGTASMETASISVENEESLLNGNDDVNME
jgi:hypothetical protein